MTQENKPHSMYVHVHTLESTLFEGPAISLTAQGLEGMFEVLPGHTSFLSAIGMGPMVIRSSSEQTVFFVSNGIVHVLADKVTVLVDEAHSAHDLDEVAVEKAREKAIEQLQNHQEGANYSEVLREIALAREQLKVIRMRKKYND